MSYRRPSGSRRQPPPTRRGPSRPVNPRYAPGLPPRRGPDTFAIALVGISSALVVLIVFLLFVNRTSTTTPTQTVQQTVVTIDPVAGGTATAVAYATSVASLPFVSAQEALSLYQAGNAKIVDVRAADKFATQHIKGAANVPENEVTLRVKDLPKEGNLILYCQ